MSITPITQLPYQPADQLRERRLLVLRRRVERGDYRVEPARVADAVVARITARARSRPPAALARP
jgi:anti-sigma28 factor (negative regulator of flagellin synthesis)